MSSATIKAKPLRVLRSLDCAALLMPWGTQADGEGMAFLTSGSRMGDGTNTPEFKTLLLDGIRSRRQFKSGQSICSKSGHFYLLPTVLFAVLFAADARRSSLGSADEFQEANNLFVPPGKTSISKFAPRNLEQFKSRKIGRFFDLVRCTHSRARLTQWKARTKKTAPSKASSR